MPTSTPTPPPPTFDVEARFRQCLGKRRRKRSPADRARRLRAATREVEFQLSEWERETGNSLEAARLRLRILSQEEDPPRVARIVSGLLRAASLLGAKAIVAGATAAGWRRSRD